MPGRLPNVERATVSEAKVTAYLLSESHPDGRGKARFFSRHGFSVARWEEMATALRRHAAENAVAEVVETAFGVRYVIEGALLTPDGGRP